MRAALLFSPDTGRVEELLLSVMTVSVPAGKPEWVDDPQIKVIDLHKHLVKNPQTTFGLTAYGDSMSDEGIETGDLLIVDRKAEPKDNSIVIVEVDGEFTVKKLSRVGRRLWLVPANKNHQPQEVKRHQECRVWGVVTFIIKKV